MMTHWQRFRMYFMLRYRLERKSLDDRRTTVCQVANRVSLHRVQPFIGNQWGILPLSDSQTLHPAPGNVPEVWP